MSDDQFIIDLIVKMKDEGVKTGIKDLVNEINRVSEGTKNTGIDKMSRDLLKLSQDAGKAETATRGWAESLKSVQKAQLQATGATGTPAEEMAKRSQQTALYNQYLYDEAKAKDKVAAATTKVQEAENKVAATADRAIGQRDAHVQAFNRQNAATEAASKQTALYNQYLHDEAKAADKVAKASEKHAQSLSTTRYALYDVAGTATIAGVAMAGLATAVFATGIAWERDFANVIRTASLDGDVEKIKELREQFVELNQTLPVAASQIAEIGALGGQLGIDSSGLQDFTTVVAQLTATTDLSAEAAGTALGRFQALMGVPSSEFSNLASSILKVGVNSVATETQIVNTATQISSMGRFAGLSADQVVGLAGALASVGAQPELARGTVTRVFTIMSKAIADGGERLDTFARISGMSAAQFKASWGTEAFAGTFQAFLKGIDAEGGNAVQTLNDLGISSVRDVPLVMRLGDAMGTVNRSFADAKTGYKDNTELANQYSIVAETMAAKLQLLANNFQQFLVALADGGAVFGGVVDGATDLLKWLTELANTPFVGEVLQWGVVLMGVVGILLLVAGSLARTAGAIIGLSQAYTGLAISSGSANAQLGASAGMMNALGLSGGKATVAIRALGVAMKALSVIGLALVLPEIAKWADDSIKSMTGVSREFDDTAARFAESTAFEISSGTDNPIARWAREAGEGLGLFAYEGQRDLQDLQDAMMDAASGGQAEVLAGQFEILANATDWDLSRITREMPGLADAMDKAGISVTQLKDGTFEYKNAAEQVVEPMDAATVAANALATEQAAAEAATDALAASLGLMPEELAGLQEALTAGSGKFFDFAEAAKKAYGDTGKGISQFIEALDEQLVAHEAWSTNVTILTARGASAFVTELAKMGPEGAKLAADAVLLTGEELAKLEEKTRREAELSSTAFAQTIAENTPMMAAAYGVAGEEGVKKLQEALGKGDGAVKEALTTMAATARANPIPVDATTSAAISAVENFVRQMSLKSITIRVNTSTDGSISRVLPGLGTYSKNYASGGSVYGPGTGTSDSIPARLSNGEYVITAARVRQFGVGYFDSLNSGRAPRQFAAGGPVTPAPVASASSGMTSLDPAAMRLLRDISDRIGNVEVSFVDISRAAAAGDRSLVGRGGR